MAYLSSDPFDTLFQFQNALDQLRSSNWLEASPSASGGYPPMNIFRKGEDIVMVVEVPGVRKADLRIEAKGNTIRLAGTKTVEEAGNASVHRVERRGGHFDRAITLPIEIDADRIQAECRDGILAVHLPRAERDKPRKISIA